ncbi:hypothetical protein evm_003387 [Chilo suppressalis]|nr:hypothetical protein evm_003387 [Chilo suppressalis]
MRQRTSLRKVEHSGFPARIRASVCGSNLHLTGDHKLITLPFGGVVFLLTVDKAVCTEESGAVRLEAVLVALVERKARALHAEQARRRARHPLLLLLRDHFPDEEASMIGNQGDELPSHWCEHEIARHKQKKLKLHTHHSEMCSPDQLELERRRRRRRRSPHTHSQKPRKHRTLLVSAIDEQAKVIHVRTGGY